MGHYVYEDTAEDDWCLLLYPSPNTLDFGDGGAIAILIRYEDRRRSLRPARNRHLDGLSAHSQDPQGRRRDRPSNGIVSSVSDT
jgi:hypothetical protein